MNKIAHMTFAAAFSLAAMTSLSKADFCENKVYEVVNRQLNSTFNEQTAEIRDVMAILESQGKTQGAVYQGLQASLNQASNDARGVAQQVAQRGVHECRNQVAPFQNVADGLMLSVTGGLSAVLPKHMTHIDMGEVLSGNWRGGDGSVVNHILRPLGF